VGRSVHLLDAAVPAMVGAIISVGVVVRGDADSRPLAIALALTAAVTLLARRHAPVATLAVSGSLVLILFAIDQRAGAAAVVAPAVALYSVALTRGRTQRLIAGAAAVGAVALADTLIPGHHVRFATFGHIALVAVPLLAAEALRNRRAYISLLLERLDRAERTREEEAQRRAEQERLRIARDLHDVVAHTLTTINVQAGVAAHLLDRDSRQAQTALRTIEAASHDALDELRTILGVLRERSDGIAPLEPTPGLEDVPALIDAARDGGLDVSVEIDGVQPDRVPDAVQVAAFRIVQESLTNTRRHSPGTEAVVKLSFRPDRLLVTVENRVDQTANGHRRPGVGIAGMRERAAALGGTLQARPGPESFRVAAELPYRLHT
jgi:signal transduction histidine kinase